MQHDTLNVLVLPTADYNATQTTEHYDEVLQYNDQNSDSDVPGALDTSADLR